MIKNITAVRGDTIPFRFQIKTSNGENINVEDIDTMFITCKEQTDNISPILFQKTLEDVSIEDGYCHAVFNPEDTEKLKYLTYYFDIEVTLKSGYRKTKLNSLTLTDETTLHRG